MIAAPQAFDVGQAEKNHNSEPTTEWELYLYIAGQSPCSLAALANLKQICATYLAGRHRIEVIDLLVTPKLSRDDQIIAIPTLVRKSPTPIKKIIGDLSNTERTLVGLQLNLPSAAGV